MKRSQSFEAWHCTGNISAALLVEQLGARAKERNPFTSSQRPMEADKRSNEMEKTVQGFWHCGDR
jgi:hypothetical protein